MSRQRIRAAAKVRRQAQNEAFKWRDHISLIVSASVTLFALLQIAGLSGYNMQVSLALLGSITSIFTIVSRAALSSLAILG
ncbi:hypothetical protein ACGFIF_39105 [Kribbella sp. NPDC049174]|uniref:hypothetical protein n=1 Tax=Kribbella sp. NPDC049174 TaxID=3364112 RepID=UPI003723DAE2